MVLFLPPKTVAFFVRVQSREKPVIFPEDICQEATHVWRLVSLPRSRKRWIT
jgi:hypothetical protein